MRPFDVLALLLVPLLAIQGAPHHHHESLLPHHHEDMVLLSQGLPRHHYEHHPAAAQAAPAELLFPSFAFVELSLPSFPGFSASTIVQVQAKSLAGLGQHFLVLQPDQEVFATGYNYYGELGTGNTNNAYTPDKMINAFGVVDVAAGKYHSCLVIGDTTRQVQCVGAGNNGQLGRDSTSSSSRLQPVSGALAGVSEVFCGQSSSFAISAGSGHVYAWGINSYGGLGLGTSGGSQHAPALVRLPDNFNTTQVGAGYEHTCFLSSAGEVRCVGSNGQGRLGDASSFSAVYTPVAVAVSPGTTKFMTVAAGEFHTCATATDNKVYCWGGNDYYQLGTNVDTSQNKPTPVAGITNAGSVWAGGYNTFVINNNPLGNGTMAFGCDWYGVFGLGSLPLDKKSATPLPFAQNVSGIVEIRGGWMVTCILKQSNDVWCTGNQEHGQFGVGTITASLTLVKMQDFPTLAPTPPTTWQPTLAPTKQPTLAPTTLAPTKQPTSAPTKQPTLLPTAQPTSTPTTPTTNRPTKRPTSAPTAWPTSNPTKAPTKKPTAAPATAPTRRPTKAPTMKPTTAPTKAPSKFPTKAPTSKPTKAPTKAPSEYPTKAPTKYPTNYPTKAPTSKPTTKYPTKYPTKAPTSKPTVANG